MYGSLQQQPFEKTMECVDLVNLEFAFPLNIIFHRPISSEKLTEIRHGNR